MRATYLQQTYRALLFVFSIVALWQCNIEVGNPDSNMPEPMRLVQNLSFNLSVGAACSTTSDACTSAPVVLPEGNSSDIKYEMTAVKFQLSALQLKPFAEESLWTQLDLLNGGSVVLSESTDSTAVTAIAMKFESARTSPGSGTFEITGNLIMGAGSGRMVLPLKLSFDNQLLVETAVAQPGRVIDGVEFNASTWFDFSDAKSEMLYVFKAIARGACQTPEASSCLKLRENIARQVSMRISKSMSAKTHIAGKPAQPKKSP